MQISVLTIFPELYTPFLSTSLVKRAHEQHLASITIDPLFAYCAPKERIDGPTFGHGAGMVIRPEVIERAIDAHTAQHGAAHKIFFSPRGKKLDQYVLKDLFTRLGAQGHIMLLPARYEGMDARIEEEYADDIFSIGDYVLMGGDLPAMVLIEGLLRFIPGVVGKSASVEHDSFSGPFVDYPEYTAPVVWRNRMVPEVVRSGNHQEMRLWREKHAVQTTVLHHFDWLRSHVTEAADIAHAQQVIPAHYVALMHDEVLVPDARVGAAAGATKSGMTSVTSIDMHDIARSAATYGLKGFFVVTPLVDQQSIVQTLLNFWKTGSGVTYNPHRHVAMRQVELVDSFDAVIAAIEIQTGKKPLVIATSAQVVPAGEKITYFDQERVWSHGRPVLFLLGTGRGLAPQVLDRCDYVLERLYGFSSFNHLSVRSAAAIIFDRWLGVTLRRAQQERSS